LFAGQSQRTSAVVLWQNPSEFCYIFCYSFIFHYLLFTWGPIYKRKS